MKVLKKSRNYFRIGLAIFLVAVMVCFSSFLFLSGSFLEPFRLHFQKISDNSTISGRLIFKKNPAATQNCLKKTCSIGWSSEIFDIQDRQTGVSILQTNMTFFTTISIQGKAFLITGDIGGGSEQFVMFSIYEMDKNNGIIILNDFPTYNSSSPTEIGACENPFFVNGKLFFKHYHPKCSDIGNFWFQDANIYELDLTQPYYQLIDRGEKSFFLPW